MTDELEKKVRQLVSLIQKAVGDKIVEVAYSGGKDSDVILELTKMAGVKDRAEQFGKQFVQLYNKIFLID